jgi:hypothetical protein
MITRFFFKSNCFHCCVLLSSFSELSPLTISSGTVSPSHPVYSLHLARPPAPYLTYLYFGPSVCVRHRRLSDKKNWGKTNLTLPPHGPLGGDFLVFFIGFFSFVLRG